MLSRRSALSFILPTALTPHALWFGVPKHKLFIGTGTGRASSSKGIYLATWGSGRITDTPKLAAQLRNPTFLACSKDSRNLYASLEVDQGTVFAYSIDQHSAHLTVIDSQSTLGSGPAHIALSDDNHAAYATNYGSGSLTSYTILPSGALSPPVSHVQYAPADDRPEHAQPHAHEATSSPDSRWLLVNDLGSDRIYIYRTDPKTGALTNGPQPFWQGRFKSGPRHLAFHPNGRWVYNANELDSTLNQLLWNGQDGTLAAHGAPVSALPSDFRGDSALSEILVSPDGRHLYVGICGLEAIAVFRIDRLTGSLAPVQFARHGGKTARHFTLDSTQNYLLIACQDSNTIVVLARNAATGELSGPIQVVAIDSPQCLVFAS